MSEKSKLKAQITNEVARRFNTRLESLEKDLRATREKATYWWNKFNEANDKVQQLESKLAEYEDWNRRLQEYMDMSEDDRKEFIQKQSIDAKLAEKLNAWYNLMNIFK